MANLYQKHWPHLSQAQKAILLVMALHGGRMKKDECFLEIEILGLLDMSPDEFTEWEREVRVTLKAREIVQESKHVRLH